MDRHSHPSGGRGSIAALPTTFDGVTFRSRLEARWAVFFKLLGITIEYEPDAFALPNDARHSSFTNYLVDFRLPGLRCFAEVKPMSLTAGERWKCVQLARLTHSPVALLVGQPSNEWVEVVTPGDVRAWLDLFESARAGRLDLVDAGLGRPDPIERGESHPVTIAINAARSARFGT